MGDGSESENGDGVFVRGESLTAHLKNMKLNRQTQRANGYTLTSLMMTCSLMGLLLPALHQIAVIPATTQAKAANFQKAEASATMFRAKAITDQELGKVPSECDLITEDKDVLVYTVSCTEGELKSVRATVSRTFSLIGSSGNPPSVNTETRNFQYGTPEGINFAHQCPAGDEWGVNWWNRTYPSLGACTPQAAWTEESYLASNPESWLYDINNFNGWGSHPQYITQNQCNDNDGNNGHGNSGGYDCSNPANGKNKDKK